MKARESPKGCWRESLNLRNDRVNAFHQGNKICLCGETPELLARPDLVILNNYFWEITFPLSLASCLFGHKHHSPGNAVGVS